MAACEVTAINSRISICNAVLFPIILKRSFKNGKGESDEENLLPQYHNLDESGDLGRGSMRNASGYLVLAMVQMNERSPMYELEAAREELHLPRAYEFKSYKTTPQQKRVFFQAVQSTTFQVRAVVLNKNVTSARLRQLTGDALMVELIAGLTLRAPAHEIAEDVLIVDGGTPALCREIRIRLSQECRKTKRVPPFAKIVGARSRSEDGLQLADMIAGAIRLHVTGAESEIYLSFEEKVVDFWEL